MRQYSHKITSLNHSLMYLVKYTTQKVVSKWPVTQKGLAVERNGAKVENLCASSLKVGYI